MQLTPDTRALHSTPAEDYLASYVESIDQSSSATVVSVQSFCHALRQLVNRHCDVTHRHLAAPSAEDLFLFLAADSRFVERTLTSILVQQQQQEPSSGIISSEPAFTSHIVSQFINSLTHALASAHMCELCNTATRGSRTPRVEGEDAALSAFTQTASQLCGELGSLAGCEETQKLKEEERDNYMNTTAMTDLEKGSSIDYQRVARWYGTGCDSIDAVLSGCSVATASVRSTRSCLTRGFRGGWVTELYGEAGSGKTQVALQCIMQEIATTLAAEAALESLEREMLLWKEDGADQSGTCFPSTSALRRALSLSLHEQRRHQGGCVYAVSEDVPAARLAPLAAAAAVRVAQYYDTHPSLSCLLPGCVLQRVCSAVRARLIPRAMLGRLQIKTLSSLRELCHLLESGRLETALGSWGGILVVDSIAATATTVASPSSPVLAAVEDAHVPIDSVGVRLRVLAVKRGVCVVVTNQVRAIPLQRTLCLAPLKRRRGAWPSDRNAEGRRGFEHEKDAVDIPALGTAWAVTPQVRVLLAKVPGARSRRRLVLLGSPAVPPARCSYKITAEGIVDDDFAPAGGYS